MIPKICITGGDCGGKTTALSRTTQSLLKRGFHPITVPEAATLLMSGNIAPNMWPQLDFQTATIGVSKHLEDIAMHAALARPDLNPVILCDHGLATNRAFCDHDDIFLSALAANGIMSLVEARDTYTGILHLTSAADGAEAFYTYATNKHRIHRTLDEARELDARIRDAWIGAPHWREIDNSTDFEGKLARLEREICVLLGIPVPIENERTFLCEPLDRSQLPRGAQDIDIEQIYLRSNDPLVTSRIRKRGQYGAYLYFRTDKRFIAPGKNAEAERIISAREYEADMFVRDPRKGILRKIRTCFPYDRQYLEFDTIPLRDGSIIPLLELELTEENQEIRLPPFIQVIKEVTDDPAYTNAMIAERV